MTRPELKNIIVKHLLDSLSKKPILELNEQVCDFYENDPNGRKELDAAIDEVHDELSYAYSEARIQENLKKEKEDKAWEQYREVIFNSIKHKQCECLEPKPVSQHKETFCGGCGDQLIQK